jgi:Bacteriophage T4-like portal protein (Gp20)
MPLFESKTAKRQRLQTQQTQSNKSSAMWDSGMVSHYQPSQHVKTGKQGGAITRIQNAFSRVFKRPLPAQTTEQGAASAASPTTYALSLWQLRYERWGMIEDCRRMVLDDPRARKATLKFAREAVRKGCRITLTKKSKRGRHGKRLAIAEQVAADVQRLVNTNCFSWSWMLICEGCLFVQGIASGDTLVDAKRMPAAAMERNTDDTDEFVDPTQAFSQVDVTSSEEVATFPLALMYHARWCHIDGERYGTPEIIAGRRHRRLLELQEDAQAVRRMSRAAIKRLWIIGPKDGTKTKATPGTKDDIDSFREQNGMKKGRQELMDPNNVASDVFGNGLVDAKTLDGDANIDSIDDLKYAQNVYATALPTPAPLYNLDAEAVNRDVLDDLRAEWLKETSTLTEAMVELVRWLLALALLLKGILPETVQFEIHFSESSIETPSEVVARIISLRQNILGAGNNAIPDPLISRLHALQLLAEITDIDDAVAELAAIEEEMVLRLMTSEATEQPDDNQEPGAALPAPQRPAKTAVRPKTPSTPNKDRK